MPLDQNQLGLLRRADRILEEAEKADGDDADAAARVHEIVDTCLENLHGVEVQCACHVFGSTALQRVLKHSNSSQRAALAAPLFSSPPRALLTDKYGSHAVEALLASVLPELRGATELDPEGVPALFVGFCEALASGGAGLMSAALRDRYGTHVLRAAFLVLSGRPFAPRAPPVREGKR